MDVQQKFVFVGNMGAGKTTAIQTISGSDAMRMEVPLPEDEQVGDKTTTTVGFDFGVVSLQGAPLYLYGTPGQAHFHIVAAEVMTDAVGIVLLINAGDHCIDTELDQWLALVDDAAPQVPVVVAVNRQDLQTPSLRTLREHCRARSKNVVAVLLADPRRKMEMSACLRVLTLAQLRA
jgi:uncharacterized protein